MTQTLRAGAARPARQRWLAPEVVQTSAMDCGPAALKCLLEGHGMPVSYGRLREACQTDVDGTSIDTIEVVANQLGISAEQIMVPLDHLALREARLFPAIVVVRHKDSATHFVVVWRRVGNWLQVMDPALGRRWLPLARFAEEVFHHAMCVPAVAWREWAASEDFGRPLRAQLRCLGASDTQAADLLAQALADPLWFGAAALEASVRFVRSVIDAGGLRAGPQALRLAATLFAQTHASTGDIFQVLPPKYWSAMPDATHEDGTLQLRLHGAVLLRCAGVGQAPTAPDDMEDAAGSDNASPRVSPELRAALSEKPTRPLQTLWALLREDGLLRPWALCGAMVIAAAVVLVELLLFRGLFEIGWALSLAQQRLSAIAALMLVVLVLALIEIPILSEAMRYGRHLDTRLRMALLKRLPHLGDRYFQSRPVSDMADRAHSIHLARMVPGFGLQLVQLVCDLGFTLLGVALIDAASLPAAALLALAAVSVPALVQPLLNERDLRVRSHAGALHVFNLDALLGLVPIRTHGAERVVRRQHEGLLVEWARSARGLVQMALGAQAVQSLVCLGLAGWLLLAHFARAGSASGADLLLVYWVLKLPALGQALSALGQQYPAQRNVLLRLLEPLAAPDQTGADSASPSQPNAATTPSLKAGPVALENGVRVEEGVPIEQGVDIAIADGKVLAGGHPVLQAVDLHIAAGERIAIVGASGAGKSTLLALLLGWHRLAEGSLHVDGASLSASAQEELRRATAWVDPAVQIWNRSFLDNLGYACDSAPQQRMGEVLDRSQLRQVLQQLPQGLQTLLGEGGARLSGGEGQRLRLARALMQTGARLVLLDEPFRGLDRAQRSALLAEALPWWPQATLLCVTHDVAETQGFARVLVVDGGRIVEDGVPAELARQDSHYRALLDAEERVRARLWQGTHWRRLHLHQGQLHEEPAEPVAAIAASTTLAATEAQQPPALAGALL